MEQLTEKQQEEISKLKAVIPRQAMFIGAVGGFRIGALCLLTIALNQIVQSDAFVMIGAFLSAFYGIGVTRKDITHYNQELREKVTKILEVK